MTFSSLCYGQDDFETEVVPYLPVMPIPLGLFFECNCTVDVGNRDWLVKTDVFFFLTLPFNFQIRCDSSEGQVSYYSAYYFPIGPFIRIFKHAKSANGWG